MEALINKGHIPIGMELFNAADETQWNTIKRKIDECDFYVLILSDRYGSTDDDGIGFTEKEYDYAISQSKTVISFLRAEESIQNLKSTHRETKNKRKLKEFKKKISKKLYKPWNDKNDLSRSFLLAFDELIQKAPKTAGWIKIDKIGSDWDDKIKDVNLLRKLGIEKINYETYYGISDTERFKKYLESAKDIKIIATTGRAFIHLYSSQLRKVMENGCQVTMLVATEQSEYVNDMHNLQRNNNYIRGGNDINAELAELSFFLHSNKSAKTNKPVIFGHYNTHFRANIVIIDEKIGFYTPTLPPKPSNYGISFEMVSGNLLSDCLIHFNSILDEMRKEGKVEDI